MRCFVAIEVPDDVRAAVGAAQARLREASPRADVTWSDPAKLHLTLRFLGEVTVDMAAAVGVAVEAVAARHAPLALEAAGLGTFPGPARPRVLWAGIRGDIRGLGLLAAEVERALVPLGFALESRPFRPHLTLARVRSPRGVDRITAAFPAAAARPFGAWTADALTLFRSHLRPAGSVYQPLAHMALGGASG
jgi:RNA 2',3'-cyclic 3'-phosphodiesterase